MSTLLLRFSVLCLVFVSCEDKLEKFDVLIKGAKKDLAVQKYNPALDKLNDAIRIKPDTTIGYLLRGKLFYETHKYREAISDFQKVIQFNPRSTAGLFYLGLNNFQLDRDDSAITYYNKAYATKSSGDMYFEVNKGGIFGRNFNEDVDLQVICFHRAIAYLSQGNYKDAYLDFAFAIEKKYNVGRSYMYLGLMETDLKNFPLGCKYLNLAVENGEQEADKYLKERCK
jgi:tetratricopeptide (TPR) repeat protein